MVANNETILIYAEKLRRDCKKLASVQGITYTLLFAKNNMSTSVIAGAMTRYSSYCAKQNISFDPNDGLGLINPEIFKNICQFTGMLEDDYLVPPNIPVMDSTSDQRKRMDISVEKISYDTDSIGRVLLDIRGMLRELLDELK